MKRARKLISIVLSIMLTLNIFCVLGITVSAGVLRYGDYEYSVYSNIATITKYDGSSTNVTIPSSIGGSSVTNIADSAFSGCTNLISVTIPDSVTYIGGSAFSSCTNLKSITIPESVTWISSKAFDKCKNLERVNITDLDAWCKIQFFSYDSSPLWYAHNLYLNNNLVENLVLSDDITFIPQFALAGCTSLASVIISNSVTEIGRSAFEKCTNLLNVTIGRNVSKIQPCAFCDCTRILNLTIPDSVTLIEYGVFSGCNNLNYAFYNGYKSDLSINSGNEPLTNVIKYTKDKGTFNGGEGFLDYTNGVLRITGNGNMDFGYNQTIPWSAYKNDIKSVVIESGITSIADYAFTSCTNLSSVTIPNTVTSIGESAFKGCAALMNISIPRNVSYIANDAFYGCKKIQTVNLGSNVFIGDGAFTDCTSLKNVDLSSSVSVIGDNAFSNCTSLESITIPKCDSPLGESAFSYCANLKSVEIKNGLPGIESSTFYGCSSLKSISIPDSVESIGVEAFNDCKSLTSVTIGTGCKSISSKAFWDCPKLNKITVKYPNCVFNNSQYTISSTAVICGYKNSTAYTYARSYMRSFEDIETGIRYGWIDGSFIEIPSENNPSQSTEPTEPTQPSNPTSSGSWVIVKAPTCNESGVEFNYATQESRIIPALGHKTKLVGKKAATYFAKGYTGDKKCTVCGKVVSKGKAIAKLKLATPKIKITAGKQKLTVKYTKVKDATGFQVKYTYKDKTKTKTYTSKKTVSKTIKKLKKGTYKVGVRTLIKTNGRTAYSNWTKAKQVKVK